MGLDDILLWLRNRFGKEPADFADDPIDIDELAAGLLERGIEIPADQRDHIKTVGDAIDFRERR